jgi:hypothetical protein
MDDLDKILLTSALTILGGAFVYVFGQIATEFFIKPVQQFWRMCCHIQDRLAFYAPVYEHPEKEWDNRREALEEFRRCAAQLRAAAFAIGCYTLLSRCKIVPEWSAIEDAGRNLIGLSNGLHPKSEGEGNRARRSAIETALGMPPLPE